VPSDDPRKLYARQEFRIELHFRTRRLSRSASDATVALRSTFIAIEARQMKARRSVALRTRSAPTWRRSDSSLAASSNDIR
jgi:hypothetical protein